MAITIAVSNQKGGAGKTTTTEQLAAELASAGYTVHVIDLDPQASLAKWNRKRAKLQVAQFPVHSVAPGLLEEEMLALKLDDSIDIVLTDCPGNIEDLTTRALRLSDAVVCPVRATGKDIEATMVMSRIVQSIRQENGDLRFIVFHNAKHAARKLDRDAHASFVQIFKPGAGTYVLETAIADTAAIAEAGSTGMAVREYAPKSPSALSFRKLTKEVLSCLQQSQA